MNGYTLQRDYELYQHPTKVKHAIHSTLSALRVQHGMTREAYRC